MQTLMVVAPVSFEYFPALQVLQPLTSFKAVSDEYCPAGQSLQTELPGSPVYKPAVQLRQVLLDCCPICLEYRPLTHC